MIKISLSSFFLLLIGTLSAQIDHYESLILPGDNWHYFLPTSQPSADWVNVDFDDASWQEGPSGIGYGDDDDATVIPSTMSVYMRVKVEVPAVNQVEKLLLDIDYDDGFVAYLNGQEVARSLMSGNPPAFDQPSDGDHEANLYRGIAPERYEIDPNLLQQPTNILAIEVHNWSGSSSDMTAIPVLSVGLNVSEQVYRPVPDWFVTPMDFESAELESSNLPIVIIETNGGREVPNEPKIGASMKIIFDSTATRQYVADRENVDKLNFNGPIEIEQRGSSTLELPKKQYSFTTYDEQLEKDNVELLGMPSENDWILNGLGYDPSFVRDYISYNLSRNIGQYAARGHFCEVILNGDYQGLYLLQEKLKIDNDRIDLQKMDPSDNSGDLITGGYVIKADKTEGQDVAAWSMPNSSGWTTNFVHEDPKQNEITNQQSNYIENYFWNLEQAASSRNSNIVTGYPSLIDIPSFVDFIILNELASNVDAYEFSTYFHKDRNGKLRAGPVWDFNLTYGNDLFDWGFDRSHTDVWQFDDGGNTGATFWRDLSYDNEFQCYLSRRWNELTQTGQPLSNGSVAVLIDQTVELIAEAADRDQARWARDVDYDAHIVELKRWLTTRIQWLSNQWSEQQTCTGDEVPNIAISKIHYHPADEGAVDGSDLEFIEITNLENGEVDLTGIYIGGTGLVYQFPIQSKLPAEGRLFLANDTEAFRSFYGFAPYDEFSRSLANEGQTIRLLNAFGNLVDEVTYDDKAPWPEAADGDGDFLEVIDVQSGNNDPTNWKLGNTLEPVEVQPIINSLNELKIILYPNPTTDHLMIYAKENIEEVSLVNIDGKVLSFDYTLIRPNQVDVDLSGFQKGVYFLKVQSKHQNTTEKLIIE